MLRVVRRDGEADLGVGLKAPIGGEHQETGRLERVLWRQKDTPMIDASLNFIIMSCECIATSARVAGHAQTGTPCKSRHTGTSILDREQ